MLRLWQNKENDLKHIFLSRSLSHCWMDPHWKPYISTCAYCHIQYAVIAKAETFAEDQRFLGELAGVQFENVVMHGKRSGNRSGTEDLVAGCFKQLDRGIVDQLFKFYQVDFEMFGYSPEMYFKYAKM